MSYTVSLANAPDTGIVGEPMDVRLEVCCESSSGCRDAEFFMKLNGIPIIRAPAAYISAFCIDQFGVGGGNVKSQWPEWMQTNGNGELIITKPGTYTLSWRGGSKELTVEPKPLDPALVTGDCSLDAPTDPSPGDQITLAVTVTNDNDVSATVDVSFSFGQDSETQTVTVGARGQQTVEQDFTPDEPGTFDPSHALSVQ